MINFYLNLHYGKETKKMDIKNKTLQWNYTSLWGIKLVLTDLIILGSLVICTLFSILFKLKIEEWLGSVFKNLLIMVFYIFSVFLYQRSKKRIIRFLIRTASVQILFLYLFSTVHKFQLLFSFWNDPKVINMEEAIFGIIPNIFLQQYAVPLLTEMLMFAYILYIPLYPILAAVIYFKYGEDHFEYFLFVLCTINTICNIGFIIYPVASPFWWEPLKSSYNIPMKGFFFTRIGEYIRTNVHEAGGSIPSPHCAIATVMWYFTYKYSKKLFYYLSPFIILLYISTVFCGYHYVTDSVVGILSAVIIIFLSHIYFNWLQKIKPLKG